jgi:CTP:molybdopterin cytidylyltransferase MocA
VVFAARLFPELREVREATAGLRAVVDRHAEEIIEVQFDSPVVTLDMNRPEDYEAAKASYFAGTGRGPLFTA